MDAWSGGAYDSKRDRLIVWGGGHSDYAGNEVYAFDLTSLSWLRLTEPSQDVSGTTAPFYPDGEPRSRHTYNYVEYLPNIDRFVSFGGTGPYPVGGGGFTNIVSVFNFDTLQWRHDHSQIPASVNMISAMSAYDPATGNVWFRAPFNASLMQYDPVNDSWTQHGGSDYLEYYCTPAIDPVRHIMACVGGYGGKRQLFVWDLANPNGVVIKPSTSGDPSLESAVAPGFQYDPVLKKFVGWGGGSSIYVLDPDTWCWTSINAAATNRVVPTSPNSRGTYGRFRYIPSKNAYILVNDTDENVYIYKLTEKRN